MPHEARPQLNDNISDRDVFGSHPVAMEEIYAPGISHLYGFASLSFSADTQDQTAQMLMARVQQFMAELQNETLVL